jgi:hypothetical protein
MKNHWGQHDTDCFGCKLQSLSFSPTTHPSELKDRQWAKDGDAYRRLRANGLQPPCIDGSARLERHATTSHEVESGQVLTTKKQVRQLTSIVADMP